MIAFLPFLAFAAASTLLLPLKQIAGLCMVHQIQWGGEYTFYAPSFYLQLLILGFSALFHLLWNMVATPAPNLPRATLIHAAVIAPLLLAAFIVIYWQIGSDTLRFALAALSGAAVIHSFTVPVESLLYRTYTKQLPRTFNPPTVYENACAVAGMWALFAFAIRLLMAGSSLFPAMRAFSFWLGSAV